MHANAPGDQLPARSLKDLAGDLFALILSLRQNAQYGEETALRERIQSYLGRIESEGMAARIPRDVLDAAKYPLVAFIDETILNSNWQHRERWRDRPLQLHYYGERTAGTRFFTNLAELRRQGEGRRELLEIYHICLALGFEGQYRVTGLSELARLRETLAAELGYAQRPAAEPALAPHALRRDAPGGVAAAGFPAWRAAAIAGGVLLVLFIVFYFWIEHSVGQALRLLPLPGY